MSESSWQVPARVIAHAPQLSLSPGHYFLSDKFDLFETGYAHTQIHTHRRVSAHSPQFSLSPGPYFPSDLIGNEIWSRSVTQQAGKSQPVYFRNSTDVYQTQPVKKLGGYTPNWGKMKMRYRPTNRWWPNRAAFRTHRRALKSPRESVPSLDLGHPALANTKNRAFWVRWRVW